MTTISVPLTTFTSAFKTERRPIWCAGCGDFGVLSALTHALELCQFRIEDTVLVSGIGCSSRLPFFVPAYGFHGVHGRALPLALGMKLANPSLHVIAVGGDGDGLGIGGGHIPHMARRNPDLTYLILDNAIYGLTKGQVSPTSLRDQRTASSPYGIGEAPVEPILQFLAYDVSFVARGFSARTQELTEIIIAALQHPGFAIVHIASPCPAYGGDVDFNYFESRMCPLPADFDPQDRVAAFRYASDRDVMWSGIFRRNERPTYESHMKDVRETARLSGASREFSDLISQFA